MKIGLLVDPLDNVAVATSNLKQGEKVKVGENIITVNHSIPVGHKIAIKDINKDQYIYKYGVPIGLASEDIKKGDYVHIHNVLDITEDLCKNYIECFMKEETKDE